MLKNYLKLENRTFENAIKEEKEYIERGLYYKQLERYLKYFDRDKILVLLLEDIKEQRERNLDRVLKFLGINSSSKLITSKKRSNVAKKIRFKSMINIMALISRTLINLRLSFLLYAVKKVGIKKMVMKLNTTQYVYPPMDEKTRAYLRNIFKKDIKKLEVLLKRDLSHWK